MKHKREAHILVGGQELIGVHSRYDCLGQKCPIHNPSDHHMREWDQNWNPSLRIIERICQHGIWHPDPDDINVHINQQHGCDGCCVVEIIKEGN